MIIDSASYLQLAYATLQNELIEKRQDPKLREAHYKVIEECLNQARAIENLPYDTKFYDLDGGRYAHYSRSTQEERMSKLIINEAILEKIEDLRPHLIYDVSIPQESRHARVNEVTEILDAIERLNPSLEK